jgi:hypothetical protein
VVSAGPPGFLIKLLFSDAAAPVKMNGIDYGIRAKLTTETTPETLSSANPADEAVAGAYCQS